MSYRTGRSQIKVTVGQPQCQTVMSSYVIKSMPIRTGRRSIRAVQAVQAVHSVSIITDNFTPDQLRDSSGKFTSEGGGASGNYKTVAGMKQLEGPGSLYGTMVDQQDENGNWKPARQTMHDKIIAEHLKGVTPVVQPKVIMMGGGTASGKSTMIKKGMVDDTNFVHNDADEMKTHIPEYNGLRAAHDHDAASYVHEESSYLSKRLSKEALGKSMNVLMDGTGDSGVDKFMAKVKSWRDAGAKSVVGEYATVPTSVALARAKARGEQTGRFVNEDEIKRIHRNVSNILPEAIKRGAFDEVRLWDTNKPVGTKPTLIMEAHGQTMTIHDDKAWKAFTDKAKE